MGKLPAIFLLLLALWVALTIQREGIDQAFGGLFALVASEQYGEPDPSRRSRAEHLADDLFEEREDARSGFVPEWE